MPVADRLGGRIAAVSGRFLGIQPLSGCELLNRVPLAAAIGWCAGKELLGQRGAAAEAVVSRALQGVSATQGR